jgi:hypothetical protein
MNKETARQDFIDNVFIDTKETEDQRLKHYSRCRECNEINTDNNWCLTCKAAHFRNDFDKWTSGNKEIDYFIQNTQIHAWSKWLVLEWYPWENFSKVKEIGKGGYGTVFRAKSKVRRIHKWDHQNNQWNRDEKDDDDYYYSSYVALKTIGHCGSLLNDFMNEVTNLRNY